MDRFLARSAPRGSAGSRPDRGRELFPEQGEVKNGRAQFCMGPILREVAAKIHPQYLFAQHKAMGVQDSAA
jgi:hypothetical protein